MIKILVVDDHDLVRCGIARMLADEAGFDVVGEANTGEQSVQLARELRPDVVLMDVRMPGIGGLEATKKILHYLPTVKIIAVTAMNDDMYAHRLMKAGAAGYLTKGAPANEMVDAIHTVLSGDYYMSAHMAKQMALNNFTNGDKSPFEKLSERELQTALMIARGKKVQDIADTFQVAPKTVNSYRYRIFEKLNIHNDVELTLLAVKHQMLDPEAML